jgi:hypothetical protein
MNKNSSLQNLKWERRDKGLYACLHKTQLDHLLIEISEVQDFSAILREKS